MWLARRRRVPADVGRRDVHAAAAEAR